MSTINPLFDCLYVISLDRHSDRRNALIEELDSIKLSSTPEHPYPFPDVTWFRAYEGDNLAKPDWWRGGGPAWGCFQSHLACIMDALSRNLQTFVIFEDDAQLDPTFLQGFYDFYNNIPGDWDWLYLGGQHLRQEVGKPEQINEYVLRPFNCHRNHAYIMRNPDFVRKVMIELLKPDWAGPHHLDHYWGGILHESKLCNVYCPTKFLIAQRAGLSSIQGKTFGKRSFNKGEFEIRQSDKTLTGIGAILEYSVGFGDLGLNGDMGFEGRIINIGRQHNHKTTIGCHAPARILARLDRACEVFGALNETSKQTITPVTFTYRNIDVDTVGRMGSIDLPFSSTATVRLQPGTYEFMAKIDPEVNAWAHAVFCLTSSHDIL